MRYLAKENSQSRPAGPTLGPAIFVTFNPPAFRNYTVSYHVPHVAAEFSSSQYVIIPAVTALVKCPSRHYRNRSATLCAQRKVAGQKCTSSREACTEHPPRRLRNTTSVFGVVIIERRVHLRSYQYSELLYATCGYRAHPSTRRLERCKKFISPRRVQRRKHIASAGGFIAASTSPRLYLLLRKNKRGKKSQTRFIV